MTDYRLVVADYSSIESRIVGWFTQCKFFNDTFAAGLDTYKKMAVDLFSTEYDAVTKKQRKFAKPCVLSGPYGQGAKGLRDYAENFGVVLSEPEAKHHVDTFRRRCPEIPAFWKWLEQAIQSAIVYGGHSRGYFIEVYCEGDFMFIGLPSGRRLGYYQPRIEQKETPWGEVKPTFTYMGLNQDTRQWQRLKSHMGGVTENCVAGDAEILTSRGWVRLDHYTAGDRVWDGQSFVLPERLIYQGEHATVEFEGINLTEDHRILSAHGWLPAREAVQHETDRSYWPEIRLPDGTQSGKSGGEPGLLASAMLLRGRTRCSGLRLKERVHPLLWVHAARTALREETHARHDTAPRLRCLEGNDGSLPSAVPPGVSQLRRAGHTGLQALAPVRGILGGHGRYIPARTDLGEEKQQPRVFSPELPVGAAAPTSEQPQREPFNQNPSGGDDHKPGGSKVQTRGDNALVPSGARLARRAHIRQAEPTKQKVYDLLNCGPRRQFVVRGKNKVPVIVHNCTQAMARDALAVGLVRANARGLPIVLHVHDEIGCKVPAEHAEAALAAMLEEMARPIDWAPGLLLGGAGFITKHYTKD